MAYIDPRAKVLYHIDRLDQIRRTGNTTAPLNVEIDLSNRCSHGCAWCHFAHTHSRGPLANKTPRPGGMMDCGDLMDFGLANTIIEQLSAAGVQSITWTGGGEPTLAPYFSAIVRNTHALDIDQGLYTNGGHIDEDRAELLKEVMTFVYVSLDECDEVKFKKAKGVDRFWSVLGGIDRLVSARGKATIGVGYLLHPGNIEDIPDMVAQGRRHEVDYVQFRPVIQYEQSSPGQLVEDTTWINRAINSLRRYAGDPFVQADPWRFEMYRDWAGHGYSTCHWAAMQTVITPNGKVWRCVNRRGHQGALLGDLTIDTFADIWRQSGGSCAVDSGCRLMCRGHISNITLDTVMAEPAHKSFV